MSGKIRPLVFGERPCDGCNFEFLEKDFVDTERVAATCVQPDGSKVTHTFHKNICARDLRGKDCIACEIDVASKFDVISRCSGKVTHVNGVTKEEFLAGKKAEDFEYVV